MLCWPQNSFGMTKKYYLECSYIYFLSQRGGFSEWNASLTLTQAGLAYFSSLCLIESKCIKKLYDTYFPLCWNRLLVSFTKSRPQKSLKILSLCVIAYLVHNHNSYKSNWIGTRDNQIIFLLSILNVYILKIAMVVKWIFHSSLVNNPNISDLTAEGGGGGSYLAPAAPGPSVTTPDAPHITVVTRNKSQ